jgi:hypothetical protein
MRVMIGAGYGGCAGVDSRRAWGSPGGVGVGDCSVIALADDTGLSSHNEDRNAYEHKGQSSGGCAFWCLPMLVLYEAQ